jgi:hypothetical protein
MSQFIQHLDGCSALIGSQNLSYQAFYNTFQRHFYQDFLIKTILPNLESTDP